MARTSGKEDFDQLVQIRREMELLIRDVLGDSPHQREAPAQTPTVDILETSKNIRLEIELPGVAKKDIRAFITRDTVIVEAEKKDERPPELRSYHHLERFFGKFRRVIEIPSICNTQEVKAEYKNGVLRISMPRIQERRGKRVRIEIE